MGSGPSNFCKKNKFESLIVKDNQLPAKKIGYILFTINLKSKINTISFRESIKTKKKIKLRFRRRLLFTTENNNIYMFSYYFSNFVFLNLALTVNPIYKIKHLDYLKPNNSSLVVLILEDKLSSYILILEIKKTELFKSIIFNGGGIVKQEKNEELNTSGLLCQDKEDLIEHIINSSDEISYIKGKKGKRYSSNLFNFKKHDFLQKSHFLQTMDVQSIFTDIGEDFSYMKYGSYYDSERLIIQNLNIKKGCEWKIENSFIFIQSTRRVLCLKINDSTNDYHIVFEINDERRFKIEYFPSFENGFFFNFNFNTVLFKYFSFKKEENVTLKQNLNELLKVNFEIKESRIIARYDKSIHNPRKFRSRNKTAIESFVISGKTKLKEKKDLEMNYIVLVIFYICDREIQDTQAKIKLFSPENEILSLSFGSYSNGPILAGCKNKSLLIISIFDLTVSQVLYFNGFDYSVNSIFNEKFGLSLLTSNTNGVIIAVNIISKKCEFHFYQDNSGRIRRFKKKLLK